MTVGHKISAFSLGTLKEWYGAVQYDCSAEHAERLRLG